MTNMGGKPVGTEGSLVLFSEQNSLCLKPFDSGDDYQNLSSEEALFFLLIIWFTNCQLFSPQKTHIRHPVLHPPSPPNPPPVLHGRLGPLAAAPASGAALARRAEATVRDFVEPDVVHFCWAMAKLEQVAMAFGSADSSRISRVSKCPIAGAPK
jgi:hypothetical protein